MYTLDPYDHQSECNLDLRFCACGYESCIPDNVVGPNVPDYYTLHFIIDGCGCYQSPTKNYYLKAGEGFILYPHQISYYTPNTHNPWTYYWISFKSNKAHTLLEGISTPSKPIFYHHEASMHLAKTIYQYSKASIPLALKDYQFLSYLYALFYQLKLPNRGTTLPKTPQQCYLDYALSYISQFYQKQLTIQEIAEYVHIDRTYLYKLFKDSFGISPKAYLIQYRINKACYLLEHTEIPIKEVAKAVGYDDYSLFSRIFRKQKGVSPQYYRNHL